MPTFPEWLESDLTVLCPQATYVETPLGSLALLGTDEGLIYCGFIEDSAAVVSWLAQHRVRPRPPVASDDHPVLHDAERWLLSYFTRAPMDLCAPPPLYLLGTDFQRHAYRALLDTPPGGTVGYAAISRQLGRAADSAALDVALSGCPLALFVPVHRVVPDVADRAYSTACRARTFLLRHEERRFTRPPQGARAITHPAAPRRPPPSPARAG